MTIDEAIKHCEEVAEENDLASGTYKILAENNHNAYERSIAKTNSLRCAECASEHRQLAEWMRELKKYEEGIVQIKELINDYKGHDMWDTANGMQLALECLEGSDSE